MSNGSFRKYTFCLIVFFFILIQISNSFSYSYDCSIGIHNDRLLEKKEATATQDGHRVYQCLICGREYKDILFATDHIWGEWMTDVEATCTEIGRIYRICTAYGEHSEVEIINSKGHNYVSEIEEATCTKGAKRIYRCVDCEDSYSELGEKALGHSFGEWIVEYPAREGVFGKEFRVCKNDGVREERKIPALPVVEKQEKETEIEEEIKRVFNKVDFIALGLDFIIIFIFLLLLIPLIRAIIKEKKDYNRYMRRKKFLEEEDKKYDFH